MKRLQELFLELRELTLKIEQDHPELYRYLDENPITIPAEAHPEVDFRAMTEYLDSLKQLLNHQIELDRTKKEKR